MFVPVLVWVCGCGCGCGHILVDVGMVCGQRFLCCCGCMCTRARDARTNAHAFTCTCTCTTHAHAHTHTNMYIYMVYVTCTRELTGEGIAGRLGLCSSRRATTWGRVQTASWSVAARPSILRLCVTASARYRSLAHAALAYAVFVACAGYPRGAETTPGLVFWRIRCLCFSCCRILSLSLLLPLYRAMCVCVAYKCAPGLDQGCSAEAGS